MQFNKSLVWFRRDLRSFDHAALYHALKQSDAVYCVFVFDTDILDALSRKDRRVEFILGCITELAKDLHELGGRLLIRHGAASTVIPEIARQLKADAVFVNHDYEPQAIARDKEVAKSLQTDSRAFYTFKDQVIFEKNEVVAQSGKPFSVFTPYKNAWLKALHTMHVDGGDDFYLKPYPIEPYRARLAVPHSEPTSIPSLSVLGFEPTNLTELDMPLGMSGGQQLLDDFLPRMAQYHLTRDFPSVKGPSYLSVHLRFGTVSIRSLARHAVESMRMSNGGTGAATWLSELIWRDFYAMILHHHPHIVERAFKPEYDAIRWETGENAQALFEAWCYGNTGYPLVDAAMAQINESGYMHNRLRMITASFLVKDLGIDWRWGERYFAEKLNDYDLASNNGGWQWAASTGCDAQPYFRIFNPVMQSEKFDAEGKFIKRYLPALKNLSDKHIHAPWLLSSAALQQAGLTLGKNYAEPLVQHDIARKETLERYSVVKKQR